MLNKFCEPVDSFRAQTEKTAQTEIQQRVVCANSDHPGVEEGQFESFRKETKN
jgi:hypothetical protein